MQLDMKSQIAESIFSDWAYSLCLLLLRNLAVPLVEDSLLQRQPLDDAHCTGFLHLGNPPVCGLRYNISRASSRLSSRITGGTATFDSGEWPWQASLRRNNIHRCGATLISNTWLVSAAHCFREAKNPNKWTVSFGTYLSPPLIVRLVKSIIVHEKYEYPAHEYDIAVVQLAKGVEFTSAVHRVCLPNSNDIIPYNIDAVITGWGALSNDGETPNVLQEATVKLIDSYTCNRREVYNGAIAPGMLCAGYLEGGVDSCQV
ncbi:hypothetical protein EYD10_14265 [Varanus komodoensis]|nr:hypothetical protein EYD10_14265 [Varanus komodoensis]